MNQRRIYISSTYLDLKEYRESVFATLQRTGNFNVVMMEYYSASSITPIQKCLDDVTNCDVYVGIFAWKYGYIPEGYDKSITELEYRKAIETEKRILIFLLRDDEEWPDNLKDKDELLGKIQRLRKELEEKHTVDYFQGKEELSLNVLTAIYAKERIKKELRSSSKKNYQIENVVKIIQSDYLIKNIDVKINDISIIPLIESLENLWSSSKRHAVITGEGGMGKTVSLLRLWKEYLDRADMPVPIFMDLNKFNREFYPDIKNFIFKTYKISQHEFSLLENTVSQVDNRKIPSIILLLDGFNEVTVNQKNLLYELDDILSKQGIQVVITSRFDIRSINNWMNTMSKLELQLLTKEQIKLYYTAKNNHFPFSINLSTQRLIQNPLMLSLYAGSNDIIQKNKNNNFFKFKNPDGSVQTVGELMWNFLETQFVKLFQNYMISEEMSYQYLIIKFILPFIAYEMEKSGQFFLSEDEIESVSNEACKLISKNSFWRIFPSEFKKYRSFIENKLSLNKFDDNVKSKRFFEVIEPVLCDKFNFLLRDKFDFLMRNVYKFFHPIFRDFMAAMHCINDIYIALIIRELPKTLSAHMISFDVRRYIGEILQEYNYQPCFIEEQGWYIKSQNNKSILEEILNLSRNMFDLDSYHLINLLEIWKEQRKELTGIDFSCLNLQNINLNNVRFSRLFKDKVLAAKFDGSIISKKTLFPIGHSDEITCLCFNGKGDKFISGSIDKTIKEWSILTGQCRYTRRNINGINRICYENSEDTIITSVMCDQKLFRWDLTNKHILPKTLLNFEKDYRYILFHPEKDKCIIASSICNIEEWSISKMKRLKVFKDLANNNISINSFSQTMLSLCYTPPRGDRFLAGSKCYIKEWSVENEYYQRAIYAHDGEISCLCFTENGDRFLSSSSDKTIKEWDYELGKCKRTFFGHTDTVTQVCYIKNRVTNKDTVTKEDRFLSGSLDATIKEWSVEKSRCLRTFTGHVDGITSLCCSSCGKLFLSGCKYGTIKLWSIETGECLYTFKANKNFVTSISYNNNKTKFLLGCEDNTIREYSNNPKKCLRIYNGHNDIVSCVSYRPDEKKIISGSLDRSVREWSVETGRCEKVFYDTNIVQKVGYSTDGQKIYSKSLDGNKVWKREQKEHIVINSQELQKENFYYPKFDLRDIKENDMVSGLLIQGCSFRNLHENSDLSKADIQLLSQYGSIFN